MLVVGNALAGLPMAGVVVRSIGSATLLSAGYWGFFHKVAHGGNAKDRIACLA